MGKGCRRRGEAQRRVRGRGRSLPRYPTGPPSPLRVAALDPRATARTRAAPRRWPAPRAWHPGPQARRGRRGRSEEARAPRRRREARRPRRAPAPERRRLRPLRRRDLRLRDPRAAPRPASSSGRRRPLAGPAGASPRGLGAHRRPRSFSPLTRRAPGSDGLGAR